MVLVLDEVVLTRNSIVLWLGAASLACSGVEEGAATAAASRGAQVEAGCHAGATERPVSATDAPRWLHDYGQTPISSVSSDGQGNWLVSLSGAETRKVDRDGAVIWSVPFGELVAGDGAGGAIVATARELVRLDPAGSPLYRATLSKAADARVHSLSVDEQGNAAVSGPGIGTVKVDASGIEQLRRDVVGHVALSPRGELWLTGALEGSLDFDGLSVTSQGGQDVLLLVLDAAGRATRAWRFGDAGAEQRGESIHVDSDGNVLVAGVFDGKLAFGDGSELLPTRCPSDAWCNTSGFAVKLSSDGVVLWSRELGALRAIEAARLDPSGRAVLSGALPGGVSPFESSWLTALSASGEGTWRRAEWPLTGVGSGKGVAVGPCGELLWSVTAQPELRAAEHSYLVSFVP